MTSLDALGTALSDRLLNIDVQIFYSAGIGRLPASASRAVWPANSPLASSVIVETEMFLPDVVRHPTGKLAFLQNRVQPDTGITLIDRRYFTSIVIQYMNLGMKDQGESFDLPDPDSALQVKLRDVATQYGRYIGGLAKMYSASGFPSGELIEQPLGDLFYKDLEPQILVTDDVSQILESKRLRDSLMDYKLDTAADLRLDPLAPGWGLVESHSDSSRGMTLRSVFEELSAIEDTVGDQLSSLLPRQPWLRHPYE